MRFKGKKLDEITKKLKVNRKEKRSKDYALGDLNVKKLAGPRTVGTRK